ncbi:ShlB/FhaC/HecB family hemolysin secretion/activation protein [Pseudanabaena sp. PCC 6802]|uniref:ShlB/FhaC/HecB family hemolysin secretion/activation protein n=1 Tax=Pseudanabaena sp. PCC 6802 TaxID=118173 RepID=UPI000366A77D|nr:ShlB/FhaC/HecB family hemolysin secretion/activation protein [Pseudanabaena sp. PCC 6802]
MAIGLSWLSFSPLLWAQTPNSPNTLDPTERSRPKLPALPSDLPTPQPQPLTPNPQPPIPNPQSPTPTTRILVKQVRVLGSTVFDVAELDKIVEPFIGKESTFEDLLAIRTAITQLYINRGYATSGAFLPPQDVSDGVVTVQVIEGELERLDLKGLARLKPEYVRDRIGIATQAPISILRLEAALQLLQSDPLFASVQAELKAGTAPGRSVLEVTLKEAPTVKGDLIVENRDSPSVGAIRYSASLNHINLLGFGDRLNAEVGFTSGISSYRIGYDFPINAYDGSLSINYSRDNSRIIEQPFSALDINGISHTLSLGWRQPLIRTPDREFALGLSLDLRESQTYLLGNMPFSFSPGPEDGKSRVTAIRFSQDWVNRSPTQVLAARSQFSLGIGAFNATINDSGTDGRFLSWLGQFQYVQSLGQDAILIGRIAAQLSNGSLLPIEQFSIGGLDTVRGYRQNRIVGDNGIVGSIEARLPIVREPEGIGLIQIAPFFDIGTIWNHAGVASNPSTLASIGVGLRWQIGSVATIRLDYGLPLNRNNQPGNSIEDNGFTFSVRIQAMSY